MNPLLPMSRTILAAHVLALSLITITAAFGQPPAVRGPALAPGSLSVPGPRVWSVVPLVARNRHIGPFCGSELGAIKLRLDGMQARLYFTRFLTSHASGPFVQNYLPAGYTPPQLPPELPPGSGANPRHVPGEFPGINGFHDLQLALSCIRYSGRYGGSVELIFRSEEHFEYEARQGSILWDFRNLEISQFIVPNFRRFNSGPGSDIERIYLEVRWESATAYQIAGPSAITVEADAHRSDFDALWGTFLAGNVSSQGDPAFRAPTRALMYGFINELFRTELSGTMLVSMLELDDNHLNIWTRAGTAMVMLRIGISDIDLTTLPVEGHSYVVVTATASWNSQLTRSLSFDIEGKSSIGYRTFFMFPLLQVCAGTNPSVNLSFVFRETYPLITRDSPSVSSSAPVDCVALQSAMTTGDWGMQVTRTIPIREGTSGDGSLNIDVGFLLQNQ